MMGRVTRRKGFTLLEVLVVVAIIVLLAAGAVVGYDRVLRGARIDTTKARIRDVENAIEIFQTKLGRYPSADKKLEELLTAPDDEKEAEKWKEFGPLFTEMPTDAWGKEFTYELTDSDNGPTYSIRSCGPDGVEGTDDDIFGKNKTQ